MVELDRSAGAVVVSVGEEGALVDCLGSACQLAWAGRWLRSQSFSWRGRAGGELRGCVGG